MPAPKKNVVVKISKYLNKAVAKSDAKLSNGTFTKPAAKKLKPVKPELKGALTNPKSNVKVVPSGKTKAKQAAFDAKMKYGRK